MLSDRYRVYVTETINLVRSMIIKSDQTRNAINRFLTLAGDELSSDPTQWKYYRNLAGLRYTHPSGLNNDPEIQVYSLDTDSMIPFTPAALAENPVTRMDYLTFDTSYNNLLTLYPDQELLIRGVLNPIPLEVSIAASDYTVLYMNPQYVGQGETQLLRQIQNWIDAYVARWDVPSYSVTDPLYAAGNLANIYTNLVLAILTIRLENCKTEQAHEFHIWNYLGGFYDLDRYKNAIPFQQALFLYRNIEYITAHAGKEETLQFLNRGFANPFGLELFNFDVRKHRGKALTHLEDGELDQLQNAVNVTKYLYDTSNEVFNTTLRTTPASLVKKIANVAKLNPENLEYDTTHLLDRVSHTPTMEVPTGVIEGNAVKKASVNMVNVTSEKIHNWLYLTANNYVRYKYILTVASENVFRFTISANDAAVMLLYASAAYFGYQLTTIPKPRVRDIMAVPPLTEVQIRSLVETQYMTGHLGYVPPYPKTWDRYTDIAAAQTYPSGLILSLNDFLNYINQVVGNKIQHRLFPPLEPMAVGQSELKALARVFYQNYECTFVEETTFEEFFTRLGLDLRTFSRVGLMDLILTLMSVYAGISPETDVLESPYSEMVDILEVLSSYMLAFIKGAPTSDIEPIDWDFSLPSLKGHTLTGQIDIISHGLDSFQFIPFTVSMEDKVTIQQNYTADGHLEVVSAEYQISAGPEVSVQELERTELIVLPVGAYFELRN